MENEIRKVLISEWDPFDLYKIGSPDDEFDAYIPGIYKILKGSRSSKELIEYFQIVERKYFDIAPTSNEKLVPLVSKLLSLKA